MISITRSLGKQAEKYVCYEISAKKLVNCARKASSQNAKLAIHARFTSDLSRYAYFLVARNSDFRGAVYLNHCVTVLPTRKH